MTDTCVASRSVYMSSRLVGAASYPVFSGLFIDNHHRELQPGCASYSADPQQTLTVSFATVKVPTGFCDGLNVLQLQLLLCAPCILDTRIDPEPITVI